MKRKADADRLPVGHRTAAEIRRSGPKGQHHKKRRNRTGSATPLSFPAKHEPPAFCAAAGTCAMNGRARSEDDDRIRPGRMRNPFSPLMARTPHIVPSNSDNWKRNAFAGCAHLARCANSPRNQLNKHNRPRPHLAAFYPAIGRSCMQHSIPPTQGNAGVRQTAISGTACRSCGSTI